jgi:hypothetical protein
MGPFNEAARREGHKAMEKALTAAARVRRRFKAGRPRAIQDRVIGPMEAMNTTMTLLEKLRALTEDAGLEPSSVSAALIYRQPETPGEEHFRARMVALEAPNQLRAFFDKVMALDKPLFLGIIFAQLDREAGEQGKGQYITFAWPFPAGAKDERALIGMRERIGLLLSRGDTAGSIDN